ncbi:hypothetical protein WH47_00349 [Habropoda laboriosa]|uniref:Uncharacterized protein n=2 Tax=Habropoda laboriosa TaxID=597456 RepID=A0A0L7R248_9HYME|nr:hypothetical protein WH47_00349 [Habropoda laboriosa]
MIVPLLISVETSSEKLSFVPAEEKKALQRQSDVFLKENVKSVQDEDTNLVQKRQLNKNNRFSNEEDSRIPHGGVESRFVRSNGKGLAHKMAKDALKSPKMQETMRKLSKVSKPKDTYHVTVKVPKNRVRMANERRRQKGARHKGGRKRKRKRHHRRHEKDHSRLLKRGSPKRTSNPKREINSSSKRSDKRDEEDTLDDKSRDESSSSRSKDRKITVKIDNSDYVDFSTPSIIIEPRNTDNSAKLRESEKMIDRLMITTTKDPSKKNVGDRGIEYSDYYSDDEVLQDLAANKIPVQLFETSSNDRFARQAVNFTSYRDGNRRIDRNRRKLGKKLRDVNSLRFQNYPTIEERSTLTRRDSMLDDSSSNYPSNYESPEHRNENIDSSYPSDGNLEQSRVLEEEPGSRNNLDALEADKLNVEAQYPEKFNYINQYGNPEVAMASNELRNLNNEVVSPQVPQFQGFNDYQKEDTLDQNTMDQPQIENLRIPSAKDENIEQMEQSLQPKYSLPNSGVSNAMDQPLGKILESLGINVNGASNNFDQYPNFNENIDPYRDSSYSNMLDRPVERLLSPSYLRKRPNEDSANVKELDLEASRSRNRKNDREGHFRRHSIEDGDYDRNILGDEKPTHNMNISIAVHDTKEVANQILDTIMEELEELKTDRSKNNKREGLPCRLSGSWSTAQAGVKLDMRVVNRSIIVTLSDLATPRYHESLLNGTWNVSGHAPFKRGSPFTLIATDNTSNSLAVFAGACRVCQGVDTIAGVWSVARQPKGCSDFQVATSVYNDIFRKTKLSSLKESQGTNTTESATSKHKKRKS